MVAALDFFTSWITPTSLFLFVNLVIGTIVIISRFSHNTASYRQDEQQLQPLTRSPSLLYRLKSMEFSFYKLPPHETNTVYTEPETTARVERAPSFLERVKSFKISDYLHNTDPELEDERKGVVGSDHHVTRSLSEPSEHKVNEKKLKKWGSEKEVMVAEKDEIMEEVETTARVERAPSFLEGVKSFKISDYLHNTDPELEDERKEVVGWDHHMTRSKSEPSEHKTNAKKLKKWGSEKEVMVAEKEEIMEEVEKRRPATKSLEKRVSFGDEEVNEKADDFINRFKQQLKMQRLNSLIRFRDMLGGQQKT